MSTSEQPKGPVRSRRGRGVAAAVVLALALGGLTGCSKSEPEPPPGLNTGPAVNRGASCVDPTGDISGDADELGGSLSEPAGIDLVAAKAELTDTTLKVRFETAGPIEGTPQPEFLLFQGDVSEAARWELRARQKRNTDGWELVLTSFERDAAGNYVESPGQLVDTPVKVEGNVLSYEAPQSQLRAVSSYVWAFGATSGTDPTTLLDYCDNSTGSTTGTNPGTTAATTPTTTAPTPALRQSQTTDRGETVTVYAVESPPVSPEAGHTPAEGAPEPLPGEEPRPPFKLVVLDAKVCAPTDTGLTADRPFFVKDQDGTNWATFPVEVPAHTPAMPTTIVLAADQCTQAWVTLQIPETSQVAQVIYTVDSQGLDALLWDA